MLKNFLLATWFTLASLNCACGQQPAIASEPSTKPPTVRGLWKLDATYIDKQHGVSFRYPSAWAPATSFGYHPPALTTVNTPEPIAGFGFSAEGLETKYPDAPYASSTLEGFGIVYSAAVAANANACDAIATAIATPKHRVARLGNRLFSARETATGGMSQSAGGTLYSTYARSTCYLFETDTASLASGVYEDEKDLTPAEWRQVDIGLLKIVQSIRIRPHSQEHTAVR